MARRRSRKPSRGTYWDGLQTVLTNIPSAGAALILVDATAQEFMPATMDGIRGFMYLANSGSDAATAGVLCGCKIMYLETDDAGVITGDWNGLDTDEEDIAERQLWSYMRHFVTRGAAADASDTSEVNIELEVKAKVKLSSSGKKKLLLLVDASPTNRLQMTCYLRAHLSHG